MQMGGPIRGQDPPPPPPHSREWGGGEQQPSKLEFPSTSICFTHSFSRRLGEVKDLGSCPQEA